MSEFKAGLHPFLPFQDAAACARVRAITKEQICDHPNPDFQIQVIEGRPEFYRAFALDIVGRIQRANESGKKLVAIFPVGPVPQYRVAADIINQLRIDCHSLVSFNMDEYADADGHTPPETYEGSFQYCMLQEFFYRIDEDLRPPRSQMNFPTQDKVKGYSRMIQDAGEADVCYGGIGWCGHIAFWDPHLADRYAWPDEWQAQGAQLVDLHPITILQNALHSFRGDWSAVPLNANSIGPRDILAARHRSFWLDGAFPGSDSWQAFIARLVAHGPVSPYVPGSILQTRRTDYTILGEVANNVGVDFS